jgi:nucleoside-diphosphate-sugar epimerase
MNIIITGTDGFIGSFLAKELAKTEHKLLLIGSDKSKLEKISLGLYESHSYKDLNQNDLKFVFKNFNPDVLVHLAAYSTASDNFLDLERLINSNISYLGKVLDALKYTNLKMFIFTGTFAEFYSGNNNYDPAYLYSATKTAGRIIIDYYSKTYGFKNISICPFTVYGGIDKNKKIIDFLYDSLNSNYPIDVTSGDQFLDFVHIEDVVNLYLKVIDNHIRIPSQTIFHAGSGEGNTLKDLVVIMENESGLKANLNWGGKKYRKRDIMKAIADLKNSKEILNWKPEINLKQGIKSYMEIKKNENK